MIKAKDVSIIHAVYVSTVLCSLILICQINVARIRTPFKVFESAYHLSGDTVYSNDVFCSNELYGADRPALVIIQRVKLAGLTTGSLVVHG